MPPSRPPPLIPLRGAETRTGPLRDAGACCDGAARLQRSPPRPRRLALSGADLYCLLGSPFGACQACWCSVERLDFFFLLFPSPLGSRVCGLALGAHVGLQKLSSGSKAPGLTHSGNQRVSARRPLVWKLRCRFCIPIMLCWVRRLVPLTRCGRLCARGTPGMDW